MRRRLVRLAVVVGALAVLAMPVPASANWLCSTDYYCNISGCNWSGAGYSIRICYNSSTGQVTTSSSFQGCGCG